MCYGNSLTVLCCCLCVYALMQESEGVCVLLRDNVCLRDSVCVSLCKSVCQKVCAHICVRPRRRVFVCVGVSVFVRDRECV